MNRFFVFFILITNITLFAQKAADSTKESIPKADHTLLKEPVNHAIHGVLLLNPTSFGPAQKLNLLVGGQVAWVLNKKYVLGLAVTGLSTDVKAPRVFPVQGLNLVCNYGGLTIGYIHNSHRMIHFEGQTLIGFGQTFYRDKQYRARYDENDVFLIFEPSANAVLNVSSGFRMTAGVSYRIANRVELIGLEAKDISGFSLNLGFKLGKF